MVNFRSTRAGKRLTRRRPLAKRRRMRAPRRARGQIYRGYSFARANAGHELKAVDTNWAAGSFSALTGVSTWSALLLNGMAAGAALNERIGRKVQMKSIYIRANVSMPSTGVTGNGFIRVMLVYDRQNNATDLNANLTSLFVTDSAISLMNLDNRERFLVLYDRMTPMGLQWRDTEVFVKFKRCRLDVLFNAAAGTTFASITTGALYLLTAGHGFIGAVTSLETLGRARVRYTDT